ncbi:hypothetical protein GCM10029992_03480 [Glycomyces albus]
MKVVSIVGARPQLVKLGAVAAAFDGTEHRHVVVHTGQHYDPELSDVFFSEFGIPEPDFHLGIGSGSHGAQTGAMLAAIDPILEAERPDWVLVYGDTNSTIAGALSAVKQHMKTAHLEAGLRSFNRRMPEEHNRVLTDHCADLLLTPTEEAMRHLVTEGLGDRAVNVGDVMVDVCFRTRDAALAAADRPQLPAGIDPATPFLVATLHRAENTDDPELLTALIESLAGLPLPVALLAHPASRRRRTSTASNSPRATSSPAVRCRTGSSSPPCWPPPGSSPTPAACRRRHTCSNAPARHCAPRPSGSRPSKANGTSSCRGPTGWRPGSGMRSRAARPLPIDSMPRTGPAEPDSKWCGCSRSGSARGPGNPAGTAGSAVDARGCESTLRTVAVRAARAVTVPC